ncbi:efflux RND transporter permease subunit [Sphingobacterium bambusae]|uniref:Efflux RND transporter permease subunit n=1 Tax=Sphingobacterium bambusae TaxID=662858 RepID=A0ABW6BH55_9SPHI|nr:efflux RND transporter permease subunit [Sphingobacterium bambusae]WPL49441.1 efflux RND transporter permease subunit [Sphingobacterium bambusae]
MKKRKINFIEAAMKYKQVAIVTIVLFMALGVYSLLNMPRAENPKLDMPIAMVMAFYPGADELQTEKQVTNKIEQYLFSFEEIDKEKTKSQTKNGQTFITVHVHARIKDRKKFWSTLQHGLNVNMPQVLPNSVIGPIVDANFGEVTAQIITLSSPTRSYAELESYLDKLEDNLKLIKSVSRLNRSGLQKQQVYVSVDNKKLQQYGFDIGQIIQVLQAQNLVGYSGELKTDGTNIPVFTESQFRSEADIANQLVYTSPEGTVVRLKDVATIERRYEEQSSYVRIGDDKTLVVAIEMQPGNNIVAFGKEIEGKLAEIQSGFPDDVKIKTIVSQPEVVKDSISHFMKEFVLAILAVVVVVMLLLPLRVATVASVAAPISILITFGIINLMGVELHQVSLAALIIVLGMVVDNAIVVVDNYVEKLDEGITPWTGAWQAAQQLSLPILTATMAIIFAFAPLAVFMHGISKDFVATLPVTVAVALIVSMLVALLLTPLMCYIFIKKGLKHTMDMRKVRKKSMLDYLQQGFNTAIEAAFRWPKTTIALGALGVALGLSLAGNVEEEFFPMSETKQFNAEVWMPSGTSLEETDKITRLVESEFRKDKRVLEISSFVGMSSPRFNFAYAPEIPRTNYAQLFITTESSEAVNELVKEYLPKFKEFAPGAAINLRQLSMQEGAPIAIRVVGENLADQKIVGRRIMDILAELEGPNWIRTDYQEDFLALNLQPKEDVATRLGVPMQLVTQTLGAGLTGFSVTQMWEGDKPVDVFLRFDQQNRNGFSDIGNLSINTLYGGHVPLKELVDLTPTWHTGEIVHKNGVRTLTILAETQMGKRASVILKEAQPKIEQLKLPDGIRIEYGGDAESSTENAPGMALALGSSLVLIFLTLLFQFKTLGKTLIVLSTFPLSLLGAFMGLYLTNNPMGMTAFMGIISLIGIVVRNGIILVDYADELVRDHGYSIKSAALASAKRRMRPIFLTSAAAAVGVVPMILGGSPMWAPLGSVLAFGLIVSMILTLFVVPVLYSFFVRGTRSIEEETSDPDIEIQYKPSHH